MATDQRMECMYTYVLSEQNVAKWYTFDSRPERSGSPDWRKTYQFRLQKQAKPLVRSNLTTYRTSKMHRPGSTC